METEELEGTWPQQTFCQGGNNLQPADCVLLPLQGGYRLVTKDVVIPPVCGSEMVESTNASWESRRVNIASKSAARGTKLSASTGPTQNESGG